VIITHHHTSFDVYGWMVDDRFVGKKNQILKKKKSLTRYPR